LKRNRRVDHASGVLLSAHGLFLGLGALMVGLARQRELEIAGQDYVAVSSSRSTPN